MFVTLTFSTLYGYHNQSPETALLSAITFWFPGVKSEGSSHNGCPQIRFLKRAPPLPHAVSFLASCPLPCHEVTIERAGLYAVFLVDVVLFTHPFGAAGEQHTKPFVPSSRRLPSCASSSTRASKEGRAVPGWHCHPQLHPRTLGLLQHLQSLD